MRFSKPDEFQSNYYGRRTDSLFFQNRISPNVRDTSEMRQWGEPIRGMEKFPRTK